MKIIKKVSILLVFIVSIFISSSDVFAISIENKEFPVDTKTILEISDYVRIYNFHFMDYSNTSTLAFGLVGNASNNTDYDLSYDITVSYYDNNSILLGQDNGSGTLLKGSSDFQILSNLSILGTHSVSEISKFQVSMEVQDVEEEEEEENPLFDTPSLNDKFKNMEYVLDKYDINVIVNENNTFDITEVITAYYNIAKHGIVRDIPLRNTVVRLNGTSSNNIAQVTNLYVDNNYTTSKNNDMYSIKIGSANQALTIRAELPEGYFVGAGLSIDYQNIFAMFFPIIFVGITILLWFFFGKNKKKPVETVEFYPPENLNSLEIGYIYKGYADKKDVTSLLIYLADKGYIKITTTEEKKFLSKSEGFIITKLKEYDGNNTNEKQFFNWIFKPISRRSGNGTLKDNEVSSNELKNHLYLIIDTIIKVVNDKQNKEIIFEKTNIIVKGLIILMMIGTFGFILFRPMILENAGSGNISMLIFLIFFTAFLFFIFGTALKIRSGFGIGESFSYIVILMMLVLFWVLCLSPIIGKSIYYLIGFTVGLICIFVMAFILSNFKRRTPYGNQMLGKVRGFKNFLETAEKEKLEAMVMQDPEYFYHILPYTYVLGISDKWVKKFESITIPEPTWLDGYSSFDMDTFGSIVSSTLARTERVASSRPIESSGGSGGWSSGSSDFGSSSGSSSGGGSSGGGSGGGGGSSW